MGSLEPWLYWDCNICLVFDCFSKGIIIFVIAGVTLFLFCNTVFSLRLHSLMLFPLVALCLDSTEGCFCNYLAKNLA